MVCIGTHQLCYFANCLQTLNLSRLAPTHQSAADRYCNHTHTHCGERLIYTDTQYSVHRLAIDLQSRGSLSVLLKPFQRYSEQDVPATSYKRCIRPRDVYNLLPTVSKNLREMTSACVPHNSPVSTVNTIFFIPKYLLYSGR